MKALYTICIIALLGIKAGYSQSATGATINGLPVTTAELQREMARHRAEVFNKVRNSKGNKVSRQELLTALRKAALDSLTYLKVQEGLLMQNALWPYKSYALLLKDFQQTNKERKAMVAQGKFFVGPAQFSEVVFYDYQFTNALIALKDILLNKKALVVTPTDLENQFKLMRQTVYQKEDKYTLEGYNKQIKAAFVERAYKSFIAAKARQAKVTVNRQQLAAVMLANEGSAANYAAENTIYVDSENGNDANDGKSPAKAIQSLRKLNDTRFAAGSHILLKAGSVWVGALHPKGSGTEGKPIVIDMYGEGPKPLIDGNGMEGIGVFSLYNQQYWEVNNLELVNDAETPGDRRGVEVKAENTGVLNHIYLKNLHIHHIKGLIGNGHKEKRTAGIYITTESDKKKPTRYNDVVIDGCHIHHIQNQGIATSHESAVFDYPGGNEWDNRKLTNLLVTNNVIHHISKNAMIIRMTQGGVVEHSLCFETATDITGNTIFSRTLIGTVFQFNEGYLNRSPDADGSLYDPDINSPGTIWQYSYSHDNAHGLVWFCTEKRDDGIIVRYNLSRNDRGNLVYFNYPFTSATVYNNTFYIGKGLSPTIIREKGANPHTYSFFNNVIYNQSASASYKLANNAEAPQNRTYANNLFSGIRVEGEPADGTKFTFDPMFFNPANSNSLKAPWGYQLKANSPALKAGQLIENNGGKDYFGNPVSSAEKPAVGFFNGNK